MQAVWAKVYNLVGFGPRKEPVAETIVLSRLVRYSASTRATFSPTDPPRFHDGLPDRIATRANVGPRGWKVIDVPTSAILTAAGVRYVGPRRIYMWNEFRQSLWKRMEK